MYIFLYIGNQMFEKEKKSKKKKILTLSSKFHLGYYESNLLLFFALNLTNSVK